MLALDTGGSYSGGDTTFLYEPMLRWLAKRNKRLTDPGLLNVLKRLAGPSVYGRLHQVLLARLERGAGGEYGARRTAAAAAPAGPRRTPPPPPPSGAAGATGCATGWATRRVRARRATRRAER